MALEATHMRFALDLAEKYRVKDIERYISGSIYPDSRYATKVDRAATHPKDFMDWDVTELDDFKKGWMVHLLADEVQAETMRNLLPKVCEGTREHGGERWIRRTAIKILQDVDDAKKFDIKKYLPYLDHVEMPNGENTETMRKYSTIFQDMYTDSEGVTINTGWR